MAWFGTGLRVRSYAVRPPGWPEALLLRIGVIADLHAGGPQMPLRRVDRIVEAVNGLRPDLVVFLGDLTASHRFVTSRVSPAQSAAALARVRAPLGIHAVLGNHDWWDCPTAGSPDAARPEAERVLQAADIPVLTNSGVRLPWRDGAFWLLGLGSMWAFEGGVFGGWHGVDGLDAALAAVTDDTPAILLAHEPDIFPRVPPRVSLTLSGHTHGGQVRLPGIPPIVPSRYGSRYAYGHVVEEGRHLIVSGGLGCSVMPVRFGVPPEILLVELGQAAAGG